MTDKFYSTEINVQVVVALLKVNGIRKIVASPGTTNYSLVGSLQSDPFFEIYSSVDERSAAYIACGMAAESGEPVVLTCTGATASRNYIPGLTEAYYRKLPVLAITSHQGTDRIGQLIAQNVDRRSLPNDIANLSVELPVVKDDRDRDFVVMETNKAMLELRRNGGGPVHINIMTTYNPGSAHHHQAPLQPRLLGEAAACLPRDAPLRGMGRAARAGGRQGVRVCRLARALHRTAHQAGGPLLRYP